MQKQPVRKSKSQFFPLTDTTSRNAYVLELDKLANNPHKYEVVRNEIKCDRSGNAEVILQYIDNTDEEEHSKKSVSYFAEMIEIPGGLDSYDSLCDEVMANKINITYEKDFVYADKEVSFNYRLVFYYKRNPKNVLKGERYKSVMPTEEGAKR